MELKANIVTLEEEDSLTHIGFADDEYDTKNYVLLSFDPANPGGGLYVEVNDQKWSGYNLIRSIRLMDSSAVIELTDEGAKELNTGRLINVSILPTITNWSHLKTAIVALLRPWVPVIGE